MSGRRSAQVAEDARLLGQGSYIFEGGACLVLDGEQHWLSRELLPGERTIAQQIEDSRRAGAVARSLPRAPGVPRALASPARGLAPVPRARGRRRGRSRARRRRSRQPAPDRQRRRHAPLAGAGRAGPRPRLPPRARRRIQGGRRGRAPPGARLRARRRRSPSGIRARTSPVPPSSVSCGSWPTPCCAIPRCAADLAAHANVRVAEEGHGAGVYEAVVSALMAGEADRSPRG